MYKGFNACAEVFLARNNTIFLYNNYFLTYFLQNSIFAKIPHVKPQIAKITSGSKLLGYLEHWRRCPSPEMRTCIVTDRTVLDISDSALARKFFGSQRGVFGLVVIIRHIILAKPYFCKNP